MSLCKHGVQGLCFSCIFDKRPELEAPGFHETIKQIKEDSTNAEPKNGKCLPTTR